MTRPAHLAPLALAGLAALALAGCGGSGDATTQASTPASTAAASTATTSLPPGAPTAPVGGVLTVQLASNPTTGYEWKVDRVPAGLRLVAKTYVADQPQAAGSGGTTSFRFRGLKPGVYRLHFTYRRPFAPDDAPSREVVGVRVTAR